MTTAEPRIDERSRRQLEVVHDVLLVALVFFRPLCWDGEPGQAAESIWQLLAAGALALVAVELATGIRTTWRWGWRGLLALVVLVALLPATLGAASPAPAWCRWVGWAACLGAAAYAAQVIPGRVRLAVGALLAALAVQVLLAGGQRWWGLPAMAAAQAGGGGAFALIGGAAGDIAERIANGGIFTTFTLSNQLAAWLAMLIPLAAAVGWTSRGPARIAAALLASGGVVALVLTGAKGAWLCLALGGGLAWWLFVPGWWRWLPLPLGLAGFAGLIATGAAAGSIDVRLGYWRAACQLIADAPLLGHGCDAFNILQQHVMRPGDEPTTFVHNEVLEAALAGGVLCGALVLGVLASLAWLRPVPAPTGSGRELHPMVAVAFVVLVPYLAFLGALDGNLGWWPGAGFRLAGMPVVVWGWAIGLGLVAAAVWLMARRSVPPPAWAWTVAGGAVAASALIDFNLHAAGIVGTGAVIVCLAGAGGQEVADAPARGRMVPLALAGILTACVLAGQQIGGRLSECADLLATARMAAADTATASALGDRLGVPAGARTPVVLAAAGAKAWELAAGDQRARLQALELMPADEAALAMAEQLAEAVPASAAVRMHLARRCQAARRWGDAADAATAAAVLAPTSPRILADAAAILAEADVRLPSSGFAARAGAMRAEAARLQPLVHPRMRASTAVP